MLVLILILVSLASAASQEPRHPLSHIHPTDTDFNMTGYQVFNASSYELQDGLNLSGYSIYDQGAVEILNWDENNGKWDFTNSDIQMVDGNIQMNGNNITEIDTLHFLTGMKINGSINMSGGNIEVDNGSINNVYSIDGGGDEINLFDALDMNGNVIRDSNGALEFDTRIYIPNNDIDMAGNNIINPGNVDGVDLDFPGNGLGISDSRYQIVEDAIGNSELNNTQIFTTDGLNVSGGNVTNIDTLKFEEGTSIDGDIEINGSINTTGSLDLNDNDLNDVRSIDGGGDSVRYDDSIDLNNNNLIEPNQIQTGGQNIQVRDTTNGQDLVRLQEGGNVEIPNGNLVLPNADGNTNWIRMPNGARFSQFNSWTTIYGQSGDGSNGVRLRNSDGPGDLLRANADGNVEVPNGDLNIEGSGERSVIISNINSNGDSELEFREGGNAAGVNLYYNGNQDRLEIGDIDNNDIIRAERTGNVVIPSGNLNMNNNRIRNADDLMLQDTAGTGRNWVIEEKSDAGFNIRSNSLDVLRARSTGNVETPNGNVDLRGNRLVDTTGSNTVYVGDGSDDQIVLDSGNGVSVQGGKLDMNQNNISNFFEDACEVREAVAGVDDDGGYYCVDIADEVMDVFVNESGDSMTGDLDMRGNDIYDVGRQGIGTDNPQENLDVDGTASVENSGTRMEVDSSGDVVVTLGS